MLKLGMIGASEGNGHPFSYSAIFNGYDAGELQRRCPFPLIREYLPREHRNEVFVGGARVTHVWTQDRSLSDDIARVALIPNVVDELDDLLGVVDAVVLARDDPWNRWKIAEKLLRHGTPMFMDKQIAATKEDLDRIAGLAGPEYLWMACSAVRYSRSLAAARKLHDHAAVKTIHGVSPGDWLRYGHHLFEGIACIWGLDIEWVRSLSEWPNHEIMEIRYAHGLHATLEFIPGIHLPIQFTCFSGREPSFSVPFTDYFDSFRETMSSFVAMLNTGQRPISQGEMLGIAHVVLAGEASKAGHGVRVSPATLRPL